MSALWLRRAALQATAAAGANTQAAQQQVHKRRADAKIVVLVPVVVAQVGAPQLADPGEPAAAAAAVVQQVVQAVICQVPGYDTREDAHGCVLQGHSRVWALQLISDLAEEPCRKQQWRGHAVAGQSRGRT